MALLAFSNKIATAGVLIDKQNASSTLGGLCRCPTV